MRKKICIIYTGGTIGMVPSEKGYFPKPGFFASALERIPELKDDCVPDFDVVEFNPLLDSSNMAVAEWRKIGRAIADNYDKYDGFVVLHGTDTMAYTASALSFMLVNLNKPVILTGSQIPLCETRSDARENLLTSLLIAASGKTPEVCLYFGNKLLRGNRATKVSADGLVAFDSPNYPPLATVGIDIIYNETAIKPYNGGVFRLCELKGVPICVLKIFPGIQFGLFSFIVTEKLNGIVLETFGTGNIPSYDDRLIPIIEKAFENGTIVVVCSQCTQGTVRLGAYETSVALKKAGAVCGFDMTTESAVAKLYYLFSEYEDSAQIKHLMETDMRGEVSIPS